MDEVLTGSMNTGHRCLGSTVGTRIVSFLMLFGFAMRAEIDRTAVLTDGRFLSPVVVNERLSYLHTFPPNLQTYVRKLTRHCMPVHLL
jgi:hypothetical protein